MPFGQLLTGPPGSGKSTYAHGLHQFLSAIGRKTSIVNLDPANDSLPYPCALDIRDLITLESIQQEEELGPNGAVLYAMEVLASEEGVEWLREGLKGLGEDYVVIDCPGQVEVFTHHAGLRDLGWRMEKWGYRLVALHLTDSICLTRPSLYLSTLLLSLRAMLQLDLPHLNVLTKIDSISSYGPLPFNLEYYTQVHDLSHLLPHLADESNAVLRHPKFAALNDAVVELIEDFGLVGFETLAVEDRRSMMQLLQAVDRAGGYAFGGAEGANDTVWQVAMRESMPGAMTVQDVQERWIDRKDEFDELERREMEEAAAEAERAAREREGDLANESGGVGGGGGEGGVSGTGNGDGDLDFRSDGGGGEIDRSSVKVVRKKKP